MCAQEMVEAGKLKYIGLSEVSLDNIRKAHKIHPITAIELEWSLFTRDCEQDLVPLCRELGIGILVSNSGRHAEIHVHIFPFLSCCRIS